MKFSPSAFRSVVSKLCLAAFLMCLITAFPPIFAQAETQPDNAVENEAHTAQTGSININAATPATLASELKGIGPSKAAAIVLYREKHGAFETVDALVNVKGIGVKTVEKLRKQLEAGPYKTPKKGESLVEQEAAARAAVQSVVQRSLEIRAAASAHE